MTLNELILELQELADAGNGDREVYSTSDYGDYHHTEQLVEIECVETVSPMESGYSCSGLAFPQTEDEEDEARGNEVVVLRYTSDCPAATDRSRAFGRRR